MLGPVETVDEIDSTNRELLRRAAAGAPAGIVLVARHQTAGRGRLDRRWEAPAGSSLLVSVLLRPALPPERLHLLTFAAGLAAVDAAHDVAGVELALKWPNDVVADGPDGSRKVAGLLAEAVVEGGAVRAVVVGMGLNVNWRDDPPAGGTSLDRLAGRPVDLDEVLTRWLAHLEVALAAVGRPDGVDDLLRRYRSRCATLGRRVRVEMPAGAREAVAVDVDDHGHLVLDDGATMAVGDVVHLRNVSGS